jgi:hypothetical protein
MDLSGTWQFALDPADLGMAERWWERDLPDSIQLPGSAQAQGFGDDVSMATEWTGNIVDRSWFESDAYAPYRRPGNVKVPFWLQPDKVYAGPAWYQRELVIPAEWQGRRVTLTLERAHWETRLWLDGREIGSDRSLSTPHVYDLGCDLAPGVHRVALRVDNRMLVNVGPNAHSVSDHTQTNWNGVIGRLSVADASPLWLAGVQVYPDAAARSVRLVVRVANALRLAGAGRLSLAATAYNTPVAHTAASLSVEVAIPPDGASLELTYTLGPEAQLWDEFQPALYRLELALAVSCAGGNYSDRQTVTFGLREIRPIGSQLAVNGRPVFLRGTLECCIFPRTGYPPVDVDSWRRILCTCRAHGLNHLRFHSWCPPEAAFVAGDEEGFYFQVECASWANQGASIGCGETLDEWLYAEGERIVATYGNHPSFALMAYGNEPAGEIRDFLGGWLNYSRARDPRRVHTGGAGWPVIPENQYHNIPEPRIQAWGAGLNSRINAQPPETCTDYRALVGQLAAPVISHEIGQWCAYPNFDEIAKYTGLLHARNFEIFQEQLAAHHMADQARDFLLASGKLQALCYKEEIESALRTPGFAGFQLLSLQDFPGQGTALVGVLDAFWESKGYISAAQFQRFCAPTVVLARLERRTWIEGETLVAGLDVAHFGPSDLQAAAPYWRLVGEDGLIVVEGQLPALDRPTGALSRLGALRIDLSGLPAARQYTLVAGLATTDGATLGENDWDIWLFPAALDARRPAGETLVTASLDAQAMDRLAAGGTVLLMPGPDALRHEVELGFSAVFWNTAWTRGQAPHTLGILCDPAHPALRQFPTQYHSNWQWWELIHGATAMVLDNMLPALRPLVQPIDTWFSNRRLGLLFEARLGAGKLMVCSMDLSTDLHNRPVARQLLHSLLCYMDSAVFQPRIELDLVQLQALFEGSAS